jgi:hypothetical protein
MWAEITGVRDNILTELSELDAVEILRREDSVERRNLLTLVDVALCLGELAERIDAIDAEDDPAAALKSMEDQYLWHRRRRDLVTTSAPHVQ